MQNETLDSHLVINDENSKKYFRINDGEYIPHRIGYPSMFLKNIKRFIWQVDGFSYSITRNYCEACKFDEMNTMMYVLKYGKMLPHKYEDCEELIGD